MNTFDQKIIEKRLQKTFKKKIIIQKREQIIEHGINREQFVDYYACKCNVLDLYGSELYNALSQRFKNTAVFEVRECKLISAMRYTTKDFRIVHEDLSFDIYHIDCNKEPGIVLLKANRVD